MSAQNTPETSSSSIVTEGTVTAATGTATDVLEPTTTGADTGAITSDQTTQVIHPQHFDHPAYGNSTYNPYSQPAAPSRAPRTAADRDNTTQTLGIIGFVLAVAAVITPSFVLLPIASLVLGIIALTRKPRSKAFALTAVIISGVMLLGAILFGVGAVALFGLAAISGSVF